MHRIAVGRWSRVFAVAAVAGSAACGADTMGVDPAQDVPDSGPVVATVLEAGDTVAFVSLVRGTVPGGQHAVVRNLSAGGLTEAPMRDGGLDPVQLPARVGDSVEVETRAGDDVRRFGGMVEMRRPPVVVRTGPAMGATDVSLNSIILVVFSSPMSRETITERTIRITRDGEPVPLRIRLSLDRLSAEVQPGELWPDHEYVFLVTRGVESEAGVPLAEEYRGRFRTIDVPPVATVEVVPADTTVQVGQAVALSAILRDSVGEVLSERRVTWSVSGLATMDTAMVLRIGAPGEVVVTATSEGRSGSSRVTAEPLRFTSITAGTGHTCGLAEGGLVYCWGRNRDGELGVGDQRTRPLPALVEGLPPVREVAAGSRNTCALDLAGNPYCWGRQPTAEFHGTPPGRGDWLPYRVDGNDRLESISVGLMQACGQSVTGETGCWGMYFGGNWTILFSGPFPFVSTPTLTHVSTGDEHSCGIEPGGAVRCWGENELGQLGNGTTTTTIIWASSAAEPAPTSVLALGLGDTKDVSAGGQHTCALDGQGYAYCWGDNRQGQLGSGYANECHVGDSFGLFNCRTQPKRVESGPTYAAITAGGEFTCGLTSSGAAYCWGAGGQGQLGNGSTASSATPTRVLGNIEFLTISAGWRHACGISKDQVAYCWGSSGTGEVGTGARNMKAGPVRVPLQ
jgi:alpha-tubulin suppressor-like RCC1 family protein